MLRANRVGRIAACMDGHPEIFPVTYVVDDESIVFRTAAGTKLAATRDAEVAFEVDSYDAAEGSAASVIVAGSVEGDRRRRRVGPRSRAAAVSVARRVPMAPLRAHHAGIRLRPTLPSPVRRLALDAGTGAERVDAARAISSAEALAVKGSGMIEAPVYRAP